MNQALLYRPGSKWSGMAAFIIAATIHVSAIAFGSFHREASSLPADDAPAIGFDPMPLQPALAVPEIDPAPESLPPQTEDNLVEPSPSPRQLLSEPRSSPIRASAATLVRHGYRKADTISAPRPDYPYEARLHHLAGSGLVVVSVDPLTGFVTGGRIERSTGDALLDNSALSAFRRWRFRPGGAARIEIPVTFDLHGVSY
jgi:TonB family protein